MHSNKLMTEERLRILSINYFKKNKKRLTLYQNFNFLIFYLVYLLLFIVIGILLEKYNLNNFADIFFVFLILFLILPYVAYLSYFITLMMLKINGTKEDLRYYYYISPVLNPKMAKVFKGDIKNLKYSNNKYTVIFTILALIAFLIYLFNNSMIFSNAF